MIDPMIREKSWGGLKCPNNSIQPNQSLETTALASTPRAGARVAPAKAVSHH